MRVLSRLFMVLLIAGTTSACTLPRGAALTGEILRESAVQEPSFAVVAVTRDNLDMLAGWPTTGWSGRYHWLSGSTRGPESSILRAGDRLDLVIWDTQDNSLLVPAGQKTVSIQGLVVSPTGAVRIPFVDEIVVRGMTPDAARDKIEQALMGIAPTAQVQLAFQPGRGNSVDLVGGVASPGSYALQDRNTTILSAIAQGGGISSSLRNPLVRLVRDGKTYEIRAERLFAEAPRNIILRGGDQILVQEDQRYFTSLGATGSERLVYFEKEQITALEALSLIGGLNDSRANPRGVLVLREYPARAVTGDTRGPAQRQVVFTIDLTSADGLFAARNFKINPQDTVLATESPVTAARTVFALIGSVFGLANTVSNATN